MASAQSTPPIAHGVIELPLAVVDLTGTDAAEWLQGQVTGDLRGLGPGDARRACLCKPTGQLLAHLEVWGLPDRLRLLIDRTELPAFLARVEEAVIMEDVEAVVVPATVRHHFGPEVAEPEGGGYLSDADPAHVRRRDRTGSPGFDRVVGNDSSVFTEESEVEVEVALKLFDALTLAHGEPVPGVDTGEKTLPPELGPAFESATISYRKGCYTGQEVLMRLHSRGHTNRTWRGIVSPVPLAAGARILADGAEVGRVTRAAVHPTLGPIAAGFLRREADGRTITVETPEGPAAVEVRDLPLS